MLERRSAGELPPKPHTAHYGPSGELRYEECLTRSGFEGPYTIFYHAHRPHEARAVEAKHGFALPVAAAERSLLRRHYRSYAVERAPLAQAWVDRGQPTASGSLSPLESRVPLLFNRDLVVSVLKPEQADPVYFANGDADELFYIQEGGGVLKSLFGRLQFTAGDYVYVPKGVIHRWLPQNTPQFWLCLECKSGLDLPKQYRNPVGQLTMDAPYTHRDFVVSEFQGPEDEGISELLVKRADRFFSFEYGRSPLDVVGYDGTVYPWKFPIRAFSPKVGAVHLPPTIHGTFATKGALICSFVPRLVDFHPQAIPCPYPHSSVDVDEIIFYSDGEFSSRKGVTKGSISHHPAGIAHGPHPGNYEASIGARATNELAVMLDCFEPLLATSQALSIEDVGYHDSFRAE